MHGIPAFFWLFIIATGRRVNYCGSKMCRNTDSHTFCQFRPGPSPHCTGYIEAQLTKEEKSRLLARLNRRRNEAANGMLRGMPSAGNMLKLRWIEELAKEAQLWANQCRPPSIPEERDECRDLFSISVGQCVASVVGEAPGLRVESMVDMWYMQSLFYKGNVTSYIPPQHNRYFYGDFGQMVWSRSYMVGCGRSRFMIPWHGRLRSVERLVCNISPAGPVPYRPLWGPSAPVTTCPSRSRPDKALEALCDYQFEMDESDIADKAMTIEDHVLLNSVLEIERNESLSGIGNIDEMYFNNLAIVTMDTTECSTPLYNSMQKRDIAEVFDAKKYNVSDYYVGKIKKSPVHMKHNIHRKKISTIGRPKTYNIEELNEIGDDIDYNQEIIKDVPKNFDVIYGDYNIIGMQDGNETTVPPMPYNEERQDPTEKQTIIMSTNTFTVENKINESDTFSTIENISAMENVVGENSQIKDISIGTELYDNTTNTDLTETLIAKEKSSEDYLTDPETVRQLQNALDRMENGMQTSKPPTKVRRELRDLSTKFGEHKDTSIEDKNNKSLDRGPMLNMVLQYMPYLKQYESEILGHANSVDCVYPSVVLILSFCF